MDVGRNAGRVWAALIAAAAAVSLCAASAQAATVTVGNPFTQPHHEGDIGDNGSTDTVANTALSEPGANVTSPVSGTIIQWRVVTGVEGLPGNGIGRYVLRVLHPAGGGAYTGAGSSPQDVSSDGDHTFSANLPIHAGDLIGLDLPDNKGVAGNSLTVPGGVWSMWHVPTIGALPDGSTAAPITTFTNEELAFNAVVQYPDAATSHCKKKKHKRSAAAAKKCKKKKKR